MLIKMVIMFTFWMEARMQMRLKQEWRDVRTNHIYMVYLQAWIARIVSNLFLSFKRNIKQLHWKMRNMIGAHSIDGLVHQKKTPLTMSIHRY